MHAMYNPGSVFQAFATEKYITSLGLDSQIIDYRPSYFFTEGNILKYLIKRIRFFKAYNRRKIKFDSFISNNMRLTKLYTTYSQLLKSNQQADAFIVGSDQLWNTDYKCGSDAAYYLKFVKNGKKISYSTSVGKENIDSENIKILIKELPYFDSLSVREKTTALQLSSLLNRNVYWVSDPVFLIDLCEYRRFIKEPIIGKKYVLVYLSDSSQALDYCVDYYKKRGFFVVLAGGFTKRCFCDIHIKDVGPEDFLNLIYYSEFVISSSFHATAFSLIFHKPFLTFLPEKNGERIISILKCVGLEDRCFDSKRIPIINCDDVDWSLVDQKISDYVLSSKKYLNSCLLEK